MSRFNRRQGADDSVRGDGVADGRATDARATDTRATDTRATDTRGTDGGVRDDRVREGGVRDGVRDDRVRDDRERGGVVREERRVHDHRVLDDTAARDRFGGANWGAAFFGWIVAVGMTALLTGIIAAVATAIGYSNNVTQTDAERNAGTVTFVTALVLLAVLIVAYYAGGYVAGRMSRFDGGRQGVAVWVVGLVITIIAAVLGWLAGDQYNVLDRVDVPRIPIPTQDVTAAGIIVGIAVLLVTLLAAMLGGKVGRRYHRRVDRAY